MKALKAFIKPFESPQRSVKIKIKLIFILIQLSKTRGAGRVKHWYINRLCKVYSPVIEQAN